jgi:hypothetical protein
MRKGFLGLAIMVAMATGCTADPVPTPSADTASRTPTGSAAGPVTPPATCSMTTTTELPGTGEGVSLWAMLFLTKPKLEAGKETKIVWRMTGSGDLTIQATGPDGRTVSPAWLESHGGSTWDRPGDEWGTGWVFPVSGCWTVRAVRGAAAATLTLGVSD